MMRQTLLNVNLMVEIAVELVSTQTVVQNVFVTMVEHKYLMFHVSSFQLKDYQDKKGS